MTSRLSRQVGMKLKDSKQARVACGAEFPTPRKSKHNFTAISKQVDEMLRSGGVKAGEMVLAKMVDAAREPVQLSQTLQKLARIRKVHSLNRTVDDLADRVLDRLGRISLSHIPARTACTILRSTEGLPNASSSSIVETINDDLILKEGSVLLSSATPLDLAMLLHFLSGRASDESAMVSLVDALKLRAPELDNVSYPIALTSLAKIPSSEEARESVLGQLSQVIPSMTGAQLAQTYEGLQEMGVIDEDNAERIMTSFLSITSGLDARDWARLMVAVARARPQDLPHLLECAQPLISDAQWGSARELVEVLHSMAISSYKDPVILRALSKRLRSSILAERNLSHRLQLATSAISYMSAIRTMVTTMEELLNDVEQLLRTETATTIQIHQILSALVRQDGRLIPRPSRSGYRELVQLCEDQWCRATATTDLTERAFLSTMALFAEISKDAFSERLVQLILSWSSETDRVARLNNLDSIQLSGLLSRICGSGDSHGAEVVGKAADMIDAVYDHACHELNLREWTPSEFSIFVSRLAAAGDTGMYDAEGLSHTISLHVQRHGHEYDCRHLTLVTEALSKLSSRVQEANALGPLWHEISSRLTVFQAKQLLTIGIAMSKFTRDTVAAIQYRNFPSLTGAFLKDGTLLASLDTCSRVSLISAWSRVGALTGSLLEAVASGITESASFKHPIRDASRILFSLYCINLHSLMRNAGPSTQALVRHCRESIEAEAPFAPSAAPEDLVRVLISICASSVISSPTTASRADLVARSALEALAKFHYKWLMNFLGEGGPSRSMFTMAAAWLAEGGFSGESLGMMDEGTKSRLADLLAELKVPERAARIDLPVEGHYGSDALTMQEQSIYRRLGVNAVAMVPTPPFTVRLATRQGVAIEVLGEREVLGQREDLVAWTKIRLTLLANRGWKVVLLRPSERVGMKNADSLYELALSKIGDSTR